MSERAGVRSTKALEEVRSALLEFIVTSRNCIASAESELNRTGQWLNQERSAFWKSELRRREEAVLAAKLEIERKRMIRSPEPASVVLEQRQLARAIERRDSASVRKRNTELWIGRYDRQALLTKSSTHKLSEAINSTLPRGVAALERMISSLESYVSIRSYTPASDPSSVSPSKETLEGEAS